MELGLGLGLGLNPNPNPNLQVVVGSRRDVLDALAQLRVGLRDMRVRALGLG